MSLDVRNISKTYRGADGPVRALKDVSLTLEPGEFIAVQGPSGGGKTTLLLVIGGLLSPDTGEVLIDGTNPYVLPSDARARFRAETVGFVFQQFHLVPFLSVLDNVLAPSMAMPRWDPHWGTDAQQRARELIAHFGLEHRLGHVPGELSSGERQRTALARALLNRPKLLLADEPTGNLDRDNADAVLGYLAEFARSGGSVLLVTHEATVAEFADRVITIRDGQLLELSALSGQRSAARSES